LYYYYYYYCYNNNNNNNNTAINEFIIPHGRQPIDYAVQDKGRVVLQATARPSRYDHRRTTEAVPWTEKEQSEEKAVGDAVLDGLDDIYIYIYIYIYIRR
jgi:hypothetical protein